MPGCGVGAGGGCDQEAQRRVHAMSTQAVSIMIEQRQHRTLMQNSILCLHLSQSPLGKHPRDAGSI